MKMIEEVSDELAYLKVIIYFEQEDTLKIKTHQKIPPPEWKI